VLYRALRKIVEALRRNPSRYRRLLTREGLEKVPTFLRRQVKAARKEEQRERGRQVFASGAWSHAREISSRRYGSYDDYVAHQRSKLTDLLARGEGDAIGGPGRVEKFRARFALVPELGSPGAILCLGARLGVEVEALIRLGHFAVGIDLNPGPDNRFVVTGDFHALQFADSSVDGIYTNSLDHALDIARIAREVGRVLKPGGFFLVEIVRGYDQGETVGEWESTHWPTARSLAEQLAQLGDLVVESERDPPPGGNPRMPQYVLRKRPG
jgi:SAM-dependent methyltransferase